MLLFTLYISRTNSIAFSTFLFIAWYSVIPCSNYNDDKIKKIARYKIGT